MLTKRGDKLIFSNKGSDPLVIPPHVRFKGEVGEQATMFVSDPSGNALEFKSFKDMNRVFAR